MQSLGLHSLALIVIQTSAYLLRTMILEAAMDLLPMTLSLVNVKYHRQQDSVKFELLPRGSHLILQSIRLLPGYDLHLLQLQFQVLHQE